MRRASFAVYGLFGGLAGGLAGAFAAWPAFSAPTGQLKTTATNTVPACMAPAALMQHVTSRNPKLDPQLREIASLYQSHGQKLSLRWDYAFFQMLAETNNLSFQGARGGVSREMNNFAGISKVDGREPERFSDVSTGVLAHLHHIRLYAGDPVPSPAAQRTKAVENFIVTWSRQLKRPVRFDDMIGKWSGGSSGYARTIEAGLNEFQTANCPPEVAATTAPEDDQPMPKAKEVRAREDRNREDRQAGDDRGAKRKVKVAERGRKGKRGQPAGEDNPPPETATTETETADQPVERTAQVRRPQAGPPPVGLGAAGLALAPATPESAQGPAQAPAQGQAAPKRPMLSEAAPAAAGAGAAATAGATPGAQCKVWSASFGGEKSVLIRMSDGQVVHFTALQVNAGRESEETSAYIAAYAKGGAQVGVFPSPDQAINRAFELCPKT